MFSLCEILRNCFFISSCWYSLIIKISSLCLIWKKLRQFVRSDLWKLWTLRYLAGTGRAYLLLQLRITIMLNICLLRSVSTSHCKDQDIGYLCFVFSARDMRQSKGKSSVLQIGPASQVIIRKVWLFSNRWNCHHNSMFSIIELIMTLKIFFRYHPHLLWPGLE